MESPKVISYGKNDLNLKDTELRLGLPGTEDQIRVNNKRPLPSPPPPRDPSENCGSKVSDHHHHHVDNTDSAPPSKAKIVGWPPIRSYRKNSLQQQEGESGGIYVKVSMDGAPYLRKIDLRVYNEYSELLKALENMFKLTIGQYNEREGYKGSEFAPTYEDKDGDWMLVGDVPWDMFVTSCKRLRIMKGSEARGLGCGV